MRLGILGARKSEALQRIVDAAEVLAGRFDVPEAADALKAARHRDPAISTLVQQEAVANLLDALVASTEPKAEEPPVEPAKEPEPEAKPHTRKGKG